MTLLEEFGQFIEGSYQTTFTQETLHSARRALLDWHGALIAGADTDAASRLRDAYSEEFGGNPKEDFCESCCFYEWHHLAYC
jgi:2-methylcitrate dehydratase PrpD